MIYVYSTSICICCVWFGDKQQFCWPIICNSCGWCQRCCSFTPKIVVCVSIWVAKLSFLDMKSNLHFGWLWLAMAGYIPNVFCSICMFVGKHTIFNWYSPCWSVLSWLVTCDIHMFSGSVRVCTVALCWFGQLGGYFGDVHMPDCWSCLGNKRSTFFGVSADILNVISSVPGSPHAVSLENSGHPANQGTMKPR